jgi:hypothetical protein
MVMDAQKFVIANEVSSYLDDMEGGDVLVISKRPGGKWTVTSIAGDGYVITGFGETFEEAWNKET